MTSVHPSSCENASTRKCICRCRGKYHGVQVQHKLFEDTTIAINTGFGGEIGEVLTSIMGKKFNCWCKHTFEVTEDLFESYGVHDGGHADKDGTKYWIHAHCPKCEYDWAIWKIIQNRIPMYAKEFET